MMIDKQYEDNSAKIGITYNQFLWTIIIIGFLIRVFVILNYGAALTVNSDDRNYIFGAISFIKNNTLIYGVAWPEEHAMIIMPGIILLLSGLFKVFGYDQNGLIIVRIIFSIMGCLSIYGVSLLAKQFFNRKVALICASILAIFPPIFLQDVLILTETPMILTIIYFIYFVLKYCETRSDKHFLYLMLFYITCIMIRNNFAIMPIIFLPYFLYKKFPVKELIIKGMYAILILLLVLTPWWVRNYNVTGEFIPTTGGLGDPLLGGTLTGKNYPESSMGLSEYRDLFYDPDEENSLYMRMKREEELGKERFAQWWAEDKMGLIEDIFINKPLMSIKEPYYPLVVLDIEKKLVTKLYLILQFLAIIGSILALIRKQSRQFGVVIIFIVMYSLIMCGIFLPFARYNVPVMPLIYILSAVGILEISNVIIKISNYIVEKMRKVKMRVEKDL